MASMRFGLFGGHFKMPIPLSGLQSARATLSKKVVWRRSLTVAAWRRAAFAPAPTLMATPSRALVDEPVALEARHLPPRCPVTVRARLRCESGDLWEALAHYHADGNGVLNLSRDEAQGGSYTGCEPMGLFWSLSPTPGEREGLRLRKEDVETPYTFQVSLLNGHVSSHGARSHDEGQGEGEELAAVTVERWYTAPGVRRFDVRDDGLVGTLFVPPGPGPFPGVLDLWGAMSGVFEYRAALLASRGFASLSAAYIGHEDLPGLRNEIKVGDDYFQAVFQLLQNHPQVCGSRVAVLGLSFGGYIALRIATHLPVNPRCIISINAAFGLQSVASEGKVVSEGKVISFGKPPKMLPTRDHPGYVDCKENSHPRNLPHSVELENLRCPLLLVTSEDDRLASVLEGAAQIEKGLQAASKSHLLTWLSYPGAGHLLEPPYMPNARSSTFTTRSTKVSVFWGGQPAPHAAAAEHAWKKVLEFLECHLLG